MQLINKLSPFFSGGSFRIDPVFCNKSDMVSDCEIDRFLIQTCHLFLQRSMLKLCSPSYSREVWDYKYANVKGIKNSISLFSWKKAFENLSSNEKVDLLASSLNIFRNYNKKAKNLSKNHRPMIFFPNFCHVFERLLFDSLFVHFCNNNIFTKYQSGFMTGIQTTFHSTWISVSVWL